MMTVLKPLRRSPLISRSTLFKMSRWETCSGEGRERGGKERGEGEGGGEGERGRGRGGEGKGEGGEKGGGKEGEGTKRHATLLMVL